MSKRHSGLSYYMSEDDESIIAVLNTRFQELRTLMITIGSILAMIIAGINQVGVVDFFDEGEEEDIVCEPNWEFVVDNYVIDYDLLLNMRVSDTSLCNEIHTLDYYIAMDDYEFVGNTEPSRNTYIFTHTIEGIEEGTHHVIIEVFNGTINLYEDIVFDFEFDELEHENAIYGCTDTDAINYDDMATHDDGSCEYEQEEEEITEDCYAELYEAYSNKNNSTVEVFFDVDFSCSATATITVKVEIVSINNTEIAYIDNLTYETYGLDWDYQSIVFNNVTTEEDLEANVLVYHQEELDDMATVWV